MFNRLLLLLLLALLGTGCFGQVIGSSGGDDDDAADDDDSANPGDDDDDATEGPDDVDGDSISNQDEGQSEDVDTDGDGTPDAEDLDSDNDGIPDQAEAGDLDLQTPPYDTDNDGVPDFRDDDSDGDGISDAEEGGGDADGDGRLDSQEVDADDDGMLDADEGTGDFDGDGIPDFLDPDSDNDGVPDSIEGDGDVDGDGIPNDEDLDSDNDGIPDSIEGGFDHDNDGRPNNLDLDSDDDGIPDSVEGAVDTDGDSLIDSLDSDSDNDLLSDEFEAANGSSPTSADTDGDGTDDLLEHALGTDPNDPNDNPANNGDLVFVAPTRIPTAPTDGTIATTTNFQLVDLYVLLDHTCSMDAEIAAMKSAATQIINDLTCDSAGVPCVEDAECGSDEVCSLDGECIESPALYECVPSMWSGSGEFGGSGDWEFVGFPPQFVFVPEAVENNQSINPSPAATANSIPGSTGSGSDEVVFRAAQCMADPSLCAPDELSGCASSGVGCPGFRPDAVKVLIEITDEPDECDNCPGVSAATAGAALQAQGINFVGINAGGSSDAQSDLEALATAAGSLDSSGQPFVRSGANSAVVGPVTDAVLEIIGDVLMTTTIELTEVPGDSGDAMPFVNHLAIDNAGTDLDGDGTPDCSLSIPTTDTDGDGHPDSHVEAAPGTGVCWTVFANDNDFAPEQSAVQTYRLEFTVRGNSAILDEGSIYFVVPPFAAQ